jgi:MOB kinase activator 1
LDFGLAGVPFPRNFLSIAKTILKRLFRVYAHIYHQHFPEVVQLGEEAHLNTSFKHFIYFVQVNQRNKFVFNIFCLKRLFYLFIFQLGMSQEFSLIDRRELAPLQELIDKLANKEGR